MPVTEWSETILIAELHDEPIFSEDLDSLMARIEREAAEPDRPNGPPDVILDMKAVNYINSTNLAQLLKLRKRLLLAQRRLRICAVGSKVWSVLLITGLDGLFEFTEDVSTSLASLQIEEP